MLLLIAYLARKGLRVLEVILHIGAHRTGTTTLQRSLQQNRHNLTKNGTIVWGPSVTRGGMFSGLLRANHADDDQTQRLIDRNRGVISIELERLAQRGVKRLIVSEENILGSMRNNLRSGMLYPDLGKRLVRFQQVFGSVCTRVAMAIRPYEDYWASAIAYAIPAGHRAMGPDDLDRLVTQPRSWRRVISDVAAAFPGGEVAVWEFDQMIGHPERQFRVLTGDEGRIRPSGDIHNASVGREALREVLTDRGDLAAAEAIGPGSGRYMPFAGHHIDALEARYQEDQAWLRAGPVAPVSFVEGVRNSASFPSGIAKRGFG